jgi:hypothetical protein
MPQSSKMGAGAFTGGRLSDMRPALKNRAGGNAGAPPGGLGQPKGRMMSPARSNQVTPSGMPRPVPSAPGGPLAPNAFAPAQGFVSPNIGGMTNPGMGQMTNPGMGQMTNPGMGGGLTMERSAMSDPRISGPGGISGDPAMFQAFMNRGGFAPGANIPTAGFGGEQRRRQKIQDLLRLGNGGQGPTQFGFTSGQPFAGLGLQAR